VNPPDTAVYYTFSTIAQTLGAAVALLAALVLYRFQLLNAEVEASATHIRSFASGTTRHWMDTALLEGRPEKVLGLAGNAQPGEFAGIGPDQVRASQGRLATVRLRKATLTHRFGIALVATASLMGASVLVLSATPWLSRQEFVSPVLALGVLWFWGCLSAYVAVVKTIIE
jgi:hypothetical protein